MSDDFAGDVVAEASHQSFDRSGAELADVAAFDADRMVVVSDTREAVPGGSIQEVQLAHHSDFHEELDGPEDGGPAHAGQFTAYLLGREALVLHLQDLDNSTPGSGRPVALVFQDSHDVRV